MSISRLGLILILGGLAVSTLLFSVDWSTKLDARQLDMIHEVFNFSLTAMIAGGATLLYVSIQKDIDKKHVIAESLSNQQEISREKLLSLLNDFTEVYHNIKYIRRNLRRALTVSDDGSCYMDRSSYEDLMNKLNRHQLKLEFFARALNAKPPYLENIHSGGYQLMRTAEEYLRELIREYESRSLDKDDKSNIFVHYDSRLYVFIARQQSKYFDRDVNKKFFAPMNKFFALINTSV